MAITLKAARVNAGLTQVEAAEKLGVTQNTIYRWENNVSTPHFRFIPKICELYGVKDYDDIIFLPNNNA